MEGSKLHVVWFKRDLRIEDHRPLQAAARAGRVIPLYVVEPSLVTAPDFDRLHADFINASLLELDQALRQLGAPLRIIQAEVVEALDQLYTVIPFSHLWSHQETGTELTYARDRAVKRWVRARGITWVEHRQFGVTRGTLNRNGWQSRWEAFMAEPITPTPARLADGWPMSRAIPGFKTLCGADQPPAQQIKSVFDGLPIASRHPAVEYREPDLKGGRQAGLAYLNSFLAGRGRGYQAAMSSPVTAYASCSRLSPYLAWGCMSMREILQRVRSARQAIKSQPRGDGITASDLRSLDARLHWHCHFIQKLEFEPAIEGHCFNRVCEALRARHAYPERLEAWMRGQTGYPFIDACMRALQTRGWINFRMRAMLVSFAAYDLWIDWRDFRDWLACQFIDYEPGIHISQIQMQSGTTGINTLRMYNPIKQGYDQDPDAQFIAEWIPELQHLSKAERHTPWLSAAKPDVYPNPIVDHATAVKNARAAFRELRRNPEHQAEAQRVVRQHGSRKRATRRRAQPPKGLIELPLDGLNSSNT